MNQNFLWICTSTHYVLHNYKVSRNSVERFQRSCTDKLFSVVSFILVKFLSSKSVIPRQKMESKFPVDIHIYILCPSLLQSFRKFCFRGVALTNCFSSILISKVQKGCNTEKKKWIKISCVYAHLHIMSFITTKFHEILLSGFRGVALTRKTGLTDWQTGQKHYTLRNSLRGV